MSLFALNDKGPVVYSDQAWSEDHPIIVRSVRQFFEHQYASNAPFFSFPLFKLKHAERRVAKQLIKAFNSYDRSVTCTCRSFDKFTLDLEYMLSTPADILDSYIENMKNIYFDIRIKVGCSEIGNLEYFAQSESLYCGAISLRKKLHGCTSYGNLILRSNDFRIPKNATAADIGFQKFIYLANEDSDCALRSVRNIRNSQARDLREDKSEYNVALWWNYMIESEGARVPVFHCWLAALVNPEINTFGNRLYQSIRTRKG